MTSALATSLERDPRFALGQSIGLAATVWGYPLVEMMRTCRLQTQARNSSEAAWWGPVDRLQHVQRAAVASDRDIVTPANDLLYTTAWINLAHFDVGRTDIDDGVVELHEPLLELGELLAVETLDVNAVACGIDVQALDAEDGRFQTGLKEVGGDGGFADVAGEVQDTDFHMGSFLERASLERAFMSGRWRMASSMRRGSCTPYWDSNFGIGLEGAGVAEGGTGVTVVVGEGEGGGAVTF